MEKNTGVKCPFCNKEITEEHSVHHIIPQEETAKRDYSIERGWGKSYLKETKYIRNFRVFCCKHCYDEYEKYEKWTDKISMIAGPIGFILGIIYFILTSNAPNWFGTIVGCIVYGFGGMCLLCSPNIILYFLYGKRTSYKHALRCNAIY